MRLSVILGILIMISMGPVVGQALAKTFALDQIFPPELPLVDSTLGHESP